jgi:hypothetical protein
MHASTVGQIESGRLRPYVSQERKLEQALEGADDRREHGLRESG